MDHRNQGEQDVEIGGRLVGIPTEPAKGPGERDNHPGQSVERNEPGGLEWQRQC